MGKYCLFVMLFLLCSTFQCSSCADILNIVTSPNSSCDTCYTLQGYTTATANPSLSDNITLELQPDTHHLDSSLTLTGSIRYFMMRANTTASVLCSPRTSIHFQFCSQQQITIRDITFINCKMEVKSITRATFLRNSFMITSRDSTSHPAIRFTNPRILVQIEECTFLNTPC